MDLEHIWTFYLKFRKFEQMLEELFGEWTEHKQREADRQASADAEAAERQAIEQAAAASTDGPAVHHAHPAAPQPSEIGPSDDAGMEGQLAGAIASQHPTR